MYLITPEKLKQKAKAYCESGIKMSHQRSSHNDKKIYRLSLD